MKVIDENGPEGLTILDNHINDIFRDSKGRMWISTFGGLNVFQGDSGRMVTYSDEHSPSKTFPQAQRTLAFS